MIKLLHAGVRRYLKSVVFRVGLVATVVCGYISGNQAYWHMDSFYILMQFCIFAVVTTWLVGREYDEGIFRNKVISGHSRNKIFLSELIIGISVCTLFFLIHSVVFACYNSYITNAVPSNILVKVFIGFLTVNVAVGVICIVCACLLPNRAVTAIITILFLFCSSELIVPSLSIGLNREEYIFEYDYEEVVVTDPFGDLYIDEVEIPGSERKYENPKYIGGPLRNILETAYKLIPLSRVSETVSLLQPYLGFSYKDNYVESLSGAPLKTIDDFYITEEESRILNENIIYSGILFFGTTAIGYIGFRRKEFK